MQTGSSDFIKIIGFDMGFEIICNQKAFMIHMSRSIIIDRG